VTTGSEPIPIWLVIVFPLAFVLFWVLVTAMLGAVTGWYKLQRHFPTGTERPLVTLRMRSGAMGVGVGLHCLLTLRACPMGLRISILRMFGPFQRPFEVPWNQIRVEPAKAFFQPLVRLRLGTPEIGRLTIDARSWRRLASASPRLPSEEIAPPSLRRLALVYLLQWAALTLAVGIFFFLASRTMPDHAGVPPLVAVLLPATIFALIQAIRLLLDVVGSR